MAALWRRCHRPECHLHRACLRRYAGYNGSQRQAHVWLFDILPFRPIRGFNRGQ